MIKNFERKFNESKIDVIEKQSKLDDFESFMNELKDNMKNVNPEEIQKRLVELERYSQTPERKIEVYTDPELDTFCCGQVDSKKVNLEGEIVDDPKRKQYLIGIPFHFVAGKAPEDFLRGEINHEVGHSKWTDFGRFKRFNKLATKQGYDPKELLSLDNCIEDPRMERLVGGPLRENNRKQLFEKNSKMIIPNIAKGISEGKMSPTDQFKFIIKLESLWKLHKKDLEGVEKTWSLSDLHPRVRQEYEKIKPVIERIIGNAVKPAMKRNAEVEKLIVEDIWPAYKRLIDEFPDEQSKKQEGGGKGKRGMPSKGELPKDSPNLDPNDPSTWPPELQKFLKKMIEQHKQKLKQRAKQTKKEAEKRGKDKEKRDQEKHDLLKTRDGFEDPRLREKYNELRSEVMPVIQQLKRIFQRYLPKVDEPQYEYGRKGIRFDVKRYVRKIATGHEQPLGRRMTPEKNAMVLQILVDVSGSMYDGQRINNAVKACIVICEAAQEHNIAIEILANDDGNVKDDKKYLIKGFNDSFKGRVKSNIVAMLDKFGGENEDGDAIRAALPHLRKWVHRMKSQVDRLSSLMLFISDSTTESADTRQAVEQARQFTPFEGTAITPEGDIPAKVKYHFGPNSVVPKTIEDFPSVIQEILQRHISRLKPKE